MKHTLSVTVEDEVGVLTRISGLFARRGFNIDSLAVGPAEIKNISRITLVVNANQQKIEQLIKQLFKLVNVIDIKNLTELPSVERELALIKISVCSQTRTEIIDIATIFRAKVVDCAKNSLTLELTGDPGKLVACEQLLSKYPILQVAKTGIIALARESNVNSEFLKK